MKPSQVSNSALAVLICCLASNFKRSKENILPLAVVLLFGALFPLCFPCVSEPPGRSRKPVS